MWVVSVTGSTAGVSDLNDKKEDKVKQEEIIPIAFIKNGRGQKLWNAKRNNINGYGKTKSAAQTDLIETEIREPLEFGGFSFRGLKTLHHV